ncbi:MAG TPA: excinuclease ABC subunit C, partial [Halobacteriales archaeon]|nr:excinuclease ABC subunit C [Halobacteriales archaeon]
GREAVLVEMALKNARQNFVPTDAILALQNSLSISKATRIEAFDISHSTGEDVVGSNVVFVDGYPEKSSYRRLKLKETNDDYSNMYDLLAWRADRSISGTDSRPDPDLLIVDGGSGQLNAALKALSDLKWDVPVIALKKPNDIIITPTGNQTWPSNASHLHLIQRIRDEAHRFALTYHRHLRDDVTTTLDSISGIGPELRKRLFQNFGSIDGIRRASVVELCGIQGIGKQTAMKLKNQL